MQKHFQEENMLEEFGKNISEIVITIPDLPYNKSIQISNDLYKFFNDKKEFKNTIKFLYQILDVLLLRFV